jgi:hypothetical protein
MTDRPPGVDMQRLRPYLKDALLRQKDKRTARALADQLDQGEWRAIATFDVVGDQLDQADLNSLTYRIDVAVRDGWAELCTIHWSLVGLEWADVVMTWEDVLRQHREGTNPGGENDPNE